MTVEFITDRSLAPVTHGFFTRKGGASSGVFAGLNCGEGSSDQGEIVQLNRKRAAEAMGLPREALCSVHQVHSPEVIALTEPPTQKARADAMVTATEGLGLAILTADCAPVLFADHEARVIGAAHAGWKGALGGVLESSVDGMESLGARADNIRAVIGPTISLRSYEVGEEFFERFIDDDMGNTQFFVNGAETGKYLFDLVGFCLHRLRERGVADASWTGHCTYSDEARFFSFRRTTHRAEKDYGRQLSVIRL